MRRFGDQMHRFWGAAVAIEVALTTNREACCWGLTQECLQAMLGQLIWGWEALRLGRWGY